MEKMDDTHSCKRVQHRMGEKMTNEFNTSCCRTSSTTSLSSSDRSISSCSDISGEVNSNFRVGHDPAVADYTWENSDILPSHQSQKLESLNTFDSINSVLDLEILNNDFSENLAGVSEINHFIHNHCAKESVSGQIENVNDKCLPSYNDGDLMDAQIWVPPEAENPLDDVEGSLILHGDEDSDYMDGTRWGRPSSLSSSNDECSASFCLEETRNKEMNDVRNGKFVEAVTQLLRSEAVDVTEFEGKIWVNVVASLCWEAALFLKPDTINDKAMDPEGYVKVKCIATGQRSDSDLIKGLVFKKRAAHKHMATSYKNPRLLLIRGVLGQSSNVLSSFTAMEQEKENLKSLMEVIESCRPNLVLVEKSVSRDVQESMLAKGITLVYDMKLHRLERISRCTGSPIFSSKALISQDLRQCDAFHIEKYLEEHAAPGEGGKKPSKTLLFIEGCPTHLGCTILLKGSHSEELKRIKNVVHAAVVLAYHLIVETSFMIDCKAMLSSILPPSFDVAISSQDHTTSGASSGNLDANNKFVSESEMPSIDIPISSEDGEPNIASVNVESDDIVSLFSKPYNPAIFAGFSSVSNSLRKVLDYSLPPYYSSFSNFFRSNISQINDQGVQEILIMKSSDGSDEMEGENKNILVAEKVQNDSTMQPTFYPSEDIRVGENDTEEAVNNLQLKDNKFSVFYPQSILVLMSSRNVFRGAACEQSRFSHIMFYRNFDVPLIKFLRENLLNQKHSCNSCGDSPESHFYYFAHHSKQLVIRVKRLEKNLPGKSEGKIWMWSQCGICTRKDEIPHCTKRVLVSSLGGNLSFGRFLELTFSGCVVSGMLPSCGHSLDKDFYYFFGEGSMAAMLKFSLVATYGVSLPPTKLDFIQQTGSNLLKDELKAVYLKGMLLFGSVEDSVKKCVALNVEGSQKADEMLKHEISEFQANIHCLIKGENAVTVSYFHLTLNWMVWELLLLAFVWDQRLHLLEQTKKAKNKSNCNGAANGSDIDPQNNRNENARSDTETSSTDEELVVNHIAVDGQIRLPIKELPFESNGVHQRKVNGNSLLLNGSLEERVINISTDNDFLQNSTSSRWDSWHELFWMPFSEIKEMYVKDLRRGFFPRFQCLSDNHQNHASVHQFLVSEGSRIYVPLGDRKQIVRDYEIEHSSIIACALAYLKDNAFSEFSGEGRKDGGLFSSSSYLQITSHESDSVKSNMGMTRDESRLSSFDGLNLLESLVPLENLCPEVYLGVTKSLPKGKYSVVCVYANQFRDLRNWCCSSEDDYIASLGRCRKWDAKGGKSKSLFAKTLDDRFIIKEIKKTEFDSFVKFAPHYFKYMHDCFANGNQTCLAKVLGVYQVVIRPTKGGKETRHDLMVMENLSFGVNINRQYDLKGALHARFTTAADDAKEVLLDQNFVNDMNCSPLYVSNKAKHVLERAVWNDTNFLNSIHVMDYSLLVVVDAEKRELRCGIIDYLRQYTWDKQLETWVKSSLVVPKNVLPTVISPKEYKKRFRKFMSTHFLSVPDGWCPSAYASCGLCAPKPS